MEKGDLLKGGRVKYKTVIEIICDAHDEEDAYHTAGEYLRGNVDTGIIMDCKTLAVTDISQNS